MFIAAGVFYYFEENQMKKFFTKLADTFSGNEVVFDASSALGVRVANKRVIQGAGMDESSILKWGIETAKSIQLWDSRVEIIEEYSLFKNMKKGLPLKNKIGTLMSDILNIMFMVHLRFAVNNDKWLLLRWRDTKAERLWSKQLKRLTVTILSLLFLKLIVLPIIVLPRGVTE